VIRAVVFDLDDTLIAEHDWIVSGYTAVADQVAGDTGRAAGELVSLMLYAFEQDPRHVFDVLARELVIADDERAAFSARCIDIYRHHKPTLPSAAGGRAVIEQCRPRRIVIATGGYAVAQRAKVEAGGFSPLVDAVLFADDLPPGCEKPDVRWFHRAIELAAVDAAQCVHVADNPLKDFAPAKSLGMRTVRVRRPGGVYSAIPADDGDVDVEVSDVADVPGVIAHWDGSATE
jgi:putative hydrolase of the HAD superfamily